ncbi:MAG: RNA-binding protein [Candidatus Nitrosothermus koennekii]|nr:MAG: RNA-binding protein [Candidatus Nitrosothermus koennekii]
MSINNSIDKIMNELSSIEERRELILKGIRDILMYARKAIVLIHKSDLDEAKKHIDLMDVKHKELKELAMDDLYYYLINAETEIVEAKSLYAIASDHNLPLYEELNVKGSSYILGLLDCIGEMKRMILDLLRNDNYHKALRLFKFMEDIYSMLMPFAVYDNIMQGVRRKLDQDRILIESVREVITEESRRRAFLDELKKV